MVSAAPKTPQSTPTPCYLGHVTVNNLPVPFQHVFSQRPEKGGKLDRDRMPNNVTFKFNPYYPVITRNRNSVVRRY